MALGSEDRHTAVVRRRLRIAASACVVSFAVAIGGCGGTGSTLTAGSGHAETVFEAVPGPPFGVVTTPDGRYAFVDLIRGRVLVYAVSGFVPRLIRSVSVPGEAVGSSLTRDGRLLLIADGQGATVVSVARAEHGTPGAVLGTLSPAPGAPLQAAGAIETASSVDGRFVFVSLEYGAPGGAIAVYDLGSDAAPHFGPRDYVGAITLGGAVVGSALSPDGRDLYVTSEIARPSSLNASRMSEGTLSVISVAAAEHGPTHAVLATVPALYQPVRVALSPDGSVVWVTARASDRLLAFSAGKLLSDPRRALLATVKVGTAPVGVAVYDNGARVIVADSDRFNASAANAALTIVDARAALAHRPAVIATVRSGMFPRELAVERDGAVALVSNFASDQLEAVDLSRLR